MYNGVGVPTARGTGTNGYVQKNLSFVYKPVVRSAYNDKDRLKTMLSRVIKEPNKDIMEHERKRKLEIECVEYEMQLEEKGYSPEEIEDMVDTKRKKLWKEFQDEINKIIIVDGQEVNYREHIKNLENEAKNDKMRKAFGLNENHERSSFFGQEKPIETGLPPPSRGMMPVLQKPIENQESLTYEETNKMLSSSDEDSSPSNSLSSIKDRTKELLYSKKNRDSKFSKQSSQRRIRSRSFSRSPQKIRRSRRSRSFSRSQEKIRHSRRSRSFSRSQEKIRHSRRSRSFSKSLEKIRHSRRSRSFSKSPEKIRHSRRSRSFSRSPEKIRRSRRSRSFSKSPEKIRHSRRSRSSSMSSERSKRSRKSYKLVSKRKVETKSKNSLKNKNESKDRITRLDRRVRRRNRSESSISSPRRRYSDRRYRE